jgi:hypothetical protein
MSTYFGERAAAREGASADSEDARARARRTRTGERPSRREHAVRIQLAAARHPSRHGGLLQIGGSFARMEVPHSLTWGARMNSEARALATSRADKYGVSVPEVDAYAASQMTYTPYAYKSCRNTRERSAQACTVCRPARRAIPEAPAALELPPPACELYALVQGHRLRYFMNYEHFLRGEAGGRRKTAR